MFKFSFFPVLWFFARNYDVWFVPNLKIIVTIVTVLIKLQIILHVRKKNTFMNNCVYILCTKQLFFIKTSNYNIQKSSVYFLLVLTKSTNWKIFSKIPSRAAALIKIEKLIFRQNFISYFPRKDESFLNQHIHVQLI